MQILMCDSRYGSDDGYIVKRYETGQIYEVCDRLARSFIALGYAVPYRPHTDSLTHFS